MTFLLGGFSAADGATQCGPFMTASRFYACGHKKVASSKVPSSQPRLPRDCPLHFSQPDVDHRCNAIFDPCVGVGRVGRGCAVRAL